MAINFVQLQKACRWPSSFNSIDTKAQALSRSESRERGHYDVVRASVAIGGFTIGTVSPVTILC